MPSETATGLLIRAVDFSETSKIVTFYTREFGKLGAMAKGAKRLKSSFSVALDLLSVCRIGVIRKSSAELDILTEAVLEERFAGLRRSLRSLHAGYYLAEVLDGLTQVSEPSPPIYDLVIETLRRLAAEDDAFWPLVRMNTRLMTELGYGLQLDACVSCGAESPSKRRMALSIAGGGVVCDACAASQEGLTPVDGGTVAALRWLGKSDAAASDRLALKPAARASLWRVASGAIEYHLGRKPRTAAMLDLSSPR